MARPMMGEQATHGVKNWGISGFGNQAGWVVKPVAKRYVLNARYPGFAMSTVTCEVLRPQD